MALVTHFQELRVYQEAFEAAMRIFDLSRGWPREEIYSLTDQIRRPSRSVCGNVAEAWRKRRYPNHFVSKLSEADGEAAETQNWLNFAVRCSYVDKGTYDALWEEYEKISRGLVGMMTHADTWCGPSHLVRDSVAEYMVTTEGDIT